MLDYSKIIISGESQSGRTTLCKMLLKNLREKSLLPVYIENKRNKFKGKIINKIYISLEKQYKLEEIDFSKNLFYDRIIPILDDFHYAKNKNKLMRSNLIFLIV